MKAERRFAGLHLDQLPEQVDCLRLSPHLLGVWCAPRQALPAPNPAGSWWLGRCRGGGCRLPCRRSPGCVTALAPAALLCASARRSLASGVSNRAAALERCSLVPGTRGGMMLMGIQNIATPVRWSYSSLCWLQPRYFVDHYAVENQTTNPVPAGTGGLDI